MESTQLSMCFISFSQNCAQWVPVGLLFWMQVLKGLAWESHADRRGGAQAGDGSAAPAGTGGGREHRHGASHSSSSSPQGCPSPASLAKVSSAQ